MVPSTVSAVVQWRSSLKDVHKDKVKLVNPPFVGRGVCHGTHPYHSATGSRQIS